MNVLIKPRISYYYKVLTARSQFFCTKYVSRVTDVQQRRTGEKFGAKKKKSDFNPKSELFVITKIMTIVKSLVFEARDHLYDSSKYLPISE